FVFRNFPISSLHQYAELAAEAAEAAGAQGKYWEMHDALFENQKSLSREKIFSLGKELELDLQTFKVELNSQAYFARVKSDFMGGVKSGVNGTPSLFLNGEKYEGPVSLSELLSVISKSLESLDLGKRSA
ncbi:MAG: DsbA family protein, partial [Bdellovibrionota bacterium]